MNPIWDKNTPSTNYPAIQNDHQADVCIAGGGICGITTAYLLQKAGKKVILVERNKMGSGVSGHTSGHLTSLVDSYYHRIIKNYSLDIAKSVWEATTQARHMVGQIIKDHSLYAGFENIPGYYYAANMDQLEDLEKEFDALTQMGVRVMEAHPSEIPVHAVKAFKVEDQATINAKLYIKELSQIFTEMGGEIYENSPVTDFKSDGEFKEVEVGEYKILCRHFVQATHTPLKINPIQMEMPHYLSFVVAGTPQDTIKKGLFYDLHDPYHYIRNYNENGEEKYIVGGYDIKSGTDKDEKDQLAELEDYAMEKIDLTTMDNQWSSILFTSSDDLPFIGKDPIHADSYIACGFAGDGLTYSLVSSILNSSLIVDGEHKWEKIFDPRRFKLQSIPEILEKGADSVKHLILDRFQLDGAEVEDIKAESAKIIKVDGKHLGVYVDKDYQLFAVEASCTHMGCSLQFNNHAKSWDCGCHGSRFDVDGKILNGPAIKNLRKYEFERKEKDD